MPDYFKKISTLFLATSFLIAVFFPNFVQASLLDTIRALVTINPLFVNVSAPTEVEINKVFKIEAKIINKGGEKIENAEAEILLPPGLVLIHKDPVKEIEVIPGKREKKIFWSVQGKTIGNYVILVTASGELKGQIISAEGNTLVEVKESVRKTGLRDWLQNLLGFFQERF